MWWILKCTIVNWQELGSVRLEGVPSLFNRESYSKSYYRDEIKSKYVELKFIALISLFFTIAVTKQAFLLF